MLSSVMSRRPAYRALMLSQELQPRLLPFPRRRRRGGVEPRDDLIQTRPVGRRRQVEHRLSVDDVPLKHAAQALRIRS